jgi:hypothetical protein
MQCDGFKMHTNKKGDSAIQTGVFLFTNPARPDDHSLELFPVIIGVDCRLQVLPVPCVPARWQ